MTADSIMDILTDLDIIIDSLNGEGHSRGRNDREKRLILAALKKIEEAKSLLQTSRTVQ